VSELEEAIEAGDAERAIAVMSPLTEAERRALAPAIVAAHAEAHRAFLADYSLGAPRKRHDAAVFALFGTATLAAVRTCFHDGDARIADVLIARKPAWLQEWCDGAAARRWATVRRIVRAGACERRRSEAYAQGLMLHGTAHRTDPRELFAEQPELLEEEIWDFFRYEGTSEISLSATDKYAAPERRWSVILADLASQGLLSRERLLDASLDALELDFHQFRAGWFSRFHEYLRPTVRERAARAARYAGLLASRIPPTVSFAIDALATIAKAGEALPPETLAALAPAYRAKAKRTALAALAMGERLLEREAEPARHAPSFAGALENPAREVQSAALDILERFADRNDPALAQQLAAATPTVVPALRARVEALTPGSARVQPARNGKANGARPAAPEAAAQRHTRAALEPIASVDELIEAYGIVLESEARPSDYERVLDGVSRLCAVRPADFERITGPLRKRVARLLGDKAPLELSLPRLLFAALAQAWLGGEIRAVKLDERRKLERFVAVRVGEVAARAVRGQAAPLLAMPSDADGTLEPQTLVARLREERGCAARFDAIAALLRLRADGRADALRGVRHLEGEIAAAVRYALGDDDITIGADAALWIAASRARYPSAADPAIEAVHPNFGPDATQPAKLTIAWSTKESSIAVSPGESKTVRYHWPVVEAMPRLARPAPFDMPTVAVHEHPPGPYPYNRSTTEMIRWLGTIRPANREGWFAAGCAKVGANLNWWEAQWENRAYLEPLAERDVALGPAARRLLTLGLLAKDAAEGVLAVDGAIAGIGDGRLDAAGLDDVMDCVLSWMPYTTTKRVVPRIATAAAASPLHARLVAEAIARALERHAPENVAAVRALRELREDLLAGAAA